MCVYLHVNNIYIYILYIYISKKHVEELILLFANTNHFSNFLTQRCGYLRSIIPSEYKNNMHQTYYNSASLIYLTLYTYTNLINNCIKIYKNKHYFLRFQFESLRACQPASHRSELLPEGISWMMSSVFVLMPVFRFTPPKSKMEPENSPLERRNIYTNHKLLGFKTLVFGAVVGGFLFIQTSKSLKIQVSEW